MPSLRPQDSFSKNWGDSAPSAGRPAKATGPVDQVALSPAEPECSPLPSLEALGQSFGGPALTLTRQDDKEATAELQQNCYDVLTKLNQPVPETLDARKSKVTTPSQGALETDATGGVTSQNAAALTRRISQIANGVKDKIGGTLPAELETVFRQTLRALQDAGVREKEPDLNKRAEDYYRSGGGGAAVTSTTGAAPASAKSAK